MIAKIRLFFIPDLCTRPETDSCCLKASIMDAGGRFSERKDVYAQAAGILTRIIKAVRETDRRYQNAETTP